MDRSQEEFSTGSQKERGIQQGRHGYPGGKVGRRLPISPPAETEGNEVQMTAVKVPTWVLQMQEVGGLEGLVPAGMKFSQGEGHVAVHGTNNGPLAATFLHEGGWKGCGGQEDSPVECAACCQPHAILSVEAACQRVEQGRCRGMVCWVPRTCGLKAMSSSQPAATGPLC